MAEEMPTVWTGSSRRRSRVADAAEVDSRRDPGLLVVAAALVVTEQEPGLELADAP